MIVQPRPHFTVLHGNRKKMKKGKIYRKKLEVKKFLKIGKNVKNNF